MARILLGWVAVRCMLATALFGLYGTAQGRTDVIVAAEPWEHLLYLDGSQRPAGVIADFVAGMNRIQDRYQFDLVVLPRLRLNQYFIAKKADVYPLRTVAWTEPSLNLVATKTIVVAHDVYFTRRSKQQGGDSICKNVRAAHLAVVRGYHYGVFDNNADPAFISSHFNVDFLPSNESVVKFVQLGRAEAGIVPEAILASYFADPSVKEQLAVCDHPDSEVNLSNLVRKDGPISVEQMNAIVDLMEKSGDVAQLRAALTIPR